MYLSLLFFFFNKTLKLQLGVCICDHTKKLKLTTKQTIHNLKFLISCVLKARTPRLTRRLTVSQYDYWLTLVNMSADITAV